MNLLGDGSVLPGSPGSNDAIATAATDGEYVSTTATQRVALRDGWLVARDCRGLIVHRHVGAQVVAQEREKLREIVLN